MQELRRICSGKTILFNIQIIPIHLFLLYAFLSLVNYYNADAGWRHSDYDTFKWSTSVASVQKMLQNSPPTALSSIRYM